MFIISEPEVVVEARNQDGSDSVADENKEDQACSEGSEAVEDEQLRTALTLNEELTTQNQSLSGLVGTLQEEMSGLSEKLRKETEQVMETLEMP